MRIIELRSDPPVEDATFETLDEAIAYALHDAPPGCVVAIHDAECQHDGEDEDTCTCDPLELTAGAQA